MSDDWIDVQDELDAYRKLPEASKAIVGRRLMRAATDITKRLTHLGGTEESSEDSWLWKGEVALTRKPNPEKEKVWMEKLAEYERLHQMRDAIRREVLGG